MNPFKIHSFSSLNFKNGKSAVSGDRSSHSIFAVYKSLYNISNKIIYLICLRQVIIVMYYDKIINERDEMKILASTEHDNELSQLAEDFYNRLPLAYITYYAERLLGLDNLDIKFSFNSKYRAIELESNDFADTNPILAAAFSKCYLVNFGGEIYVDNYKQYQKGGNALLVAYVPVHLWHHSHGGGENGDKLFIATYRSDENEWKFKLASDRS